MDGESMVPAEGLCGSGHGASAAMPTQPPPCAGRKRSAG